MSRKQAGQSARQRPLWFVSGSWLLSLASIGLLGLVGNFLRSDLTSFRSCAANDAGLTVTSCGKQSLNFGDVVLIGLLIMCAALTITLLTAAWQLSRRPK